MNNLLTPLLKDKVQTLRFFRTLRANGIRHLAYRYHLNEKLADEAIEQMIDQLFEGKITGFNDTPLGTDQPYEDRLHDYLVYQILPRRAIDLIRSGQHKYEVSTSDLAISQKLNEADLLDLFGCFDVCTQLDEHLERQQLILRLKDCLNELTDKLRLIAEGMLEDHTFEEMAQKYSISLGTVKSRSFEMYKKLRLCMQVTTIVR